MKKLLLVALSLIVVAIIVYVLLPKKDYVVLVSLDAFRWDYGHLYETPFLDDIADGGVRARSLVPAYPSKTFPNHYTLATGLYPDHHGLISNRFYAPDLKLLYKISDRSAVENGDFYAGEPIWTTVEKNGMISASMFWVGSEALINGHQPRYWSSYDGSLPFTSRIDSVIHWLSLPKKKRPNFITLYFNEPDAVSHAYGPVSAQCDTVVKHIDALVGDLTSRLNKLKIGKKINLIIVSDHGMGEISSERVVNLKTEIPNELVEFYNGSSPSILVDPVDEYLDSVLVLLNSIAHIKAYSTETMPKHYHYGTHPRFPGIVAEADSGWSVIASDKLDYSMSDRGGTHGYNPHNTDMHGIFYATGPAFKKNYLSESLHNIDVYNIVCRALKIKPTENDGDKQRIKNIFK